MIVVGIDQSNTKAGVAIADTEDVPSVKVGTVKSAGKRDFTWAQRYERIRDHASNIIDKAGCAEADLVVMEEPAPSRGGQSGHIDLHGLLWVLYERLYDMRIPVLMVSSSSRAKYGTGRGNADKDQVMLSVARRYPHVLVLSNNEADAVILAAMGCRIAGRPIEDSLPKTHIDACASYTLPVTYWKGSTL